MFAPELYTYVAASHWAVVSESYLYFDRFWRNENYFFDSDSFDNEFLAYVKDVLFHIRNSSMQSRSRVATAACPNPASLVLVGGKVSVKRRFWSEATKRTKIVATRRVSCAQNVAY